MKGIFGFALFGIVIYGAYAYGLSLGAVSIHKWDIKNNAGEALTAGDVISCFFGIIFGAFALGMGAPNMKAVSEARANAASALSIINRRPKILINDLSAPAFNSNMKGNIEFKHVSYTYAS
jgi:ATP-binding cassette subfamily B (MDR/TAP) protein 1